MKKMSREERQRLVNAWKASGKSVTQFSRENGINHYTFRGWLKGERKPPAAGKPFVEVSLPHATPLSHKPIILWCGSYRIELERGFDRELLKTVLEVLGAIGVS